MIIIIVCIFLRHILNQTEKRRKINSLLAKSAKNTKFTWEKLNDEPHHFYERLSHSVQEYSFEWSHLSTGDSLLVIFCVQVNFVLKSLLVSTFTRTQNAPAELRRKYEMKFSKR